VFEFRLSVLGKYSRSTLAVLWLIQPLQILIPAVAIEIVMMVRGARTLVSSYIPSQISNSLCVIRQEEESIVDLYLSYFPRACVHRWWHDFIRTGFTNNATFGLCDQVPTNNALVWVSLLFSL
jgi:hypothetical protein